MAGISTADFFIYEDFEHLVGRFGTADTSWKNFKSNNINTWESVFWFHSTDFLSRLRILQEGNAGNRVRLFCGEVEVSWDIVILAPFSSTKTYPYSGVRH
jgi:hypothetical protein